MGLPISNVQCTNDLATYAAQQQTIANSGVLVSASAGTENENVVVKRPWLEPPEGYSPFDAQDGIDLPVVGAASTTPLTSATGAAVVLTFVVDNGYDGVINFLSDNFLGGGFQDFSGDIIWQLYADSAPIRNFNNITAQKGTVEQPRTVSPIRIYSGQTISFVVIHAANVTLNGPVVCTLTGYTYPNRG